MTGLDLISSSLRILGALSSGEAPVSNEANDALVVLNDLIDSWSTENLIIYSKVIETFQLNPAKQVYTMGTGGDFSTVRPMEIEGAGILLASTSPAVEIPIDILTFEEYERVAIKTMTSTFPLYIYPDYAFPLMNLNVWPVPTDTTNSLVLYSSKPLSQIAALTTVLSLPQGYQRALRYNLAIELAMEYGKPVSPELAEVASQAKANIKRQNSTPRMMQVDSALQASGGVWDWRSGGYRR